MSTEKKLVGDRGEQLVVEHLEREGFSIRDRNVANKLGELDIVAEKGELMCFVEVRARTHSVFGEPSMSVDRSKQGRVIRSAMLYLQQRQLTDQREVRFDVASVVGRPGQFRLEYIPAAFEAAW